MSTPRPHNEELRRDLVQATAAKLSSDGPKALSLREVSAACRTSTTAIYALFGGKEQLINAVIDEGWNSLGVALAQTPLESADPAARLRALGSEYRVWARQNPEIYQTMFTRSAPQEAPLDVITNGMRAAFVPFMQAALAAVHNTELTPDSPSAATDPDEHELASNIVIAMWVSLHGWMSLTSMNLVDDSEVSFREFLPQLVAAAIKAGEHLFDPTCGD